MAVVSFAGRLQRWRSLFPQGLALAPSVWSRRHRTVVATIVAQAFALAMFGVWRRQALPLALGEPAAILLLGAVSAWKGPTRRFRSTIASLACVSCSAVLVQFSGGYIEAHFHYFIMVALIALYQDWLPLLVAVAYVAFDHGVVGQLFPASVYNHPEAVTRPWFWAGVHAVMVLGQCAALLVFWRGAERERARSDVVLDAAAEGLLGVDEKQRVQFSNPAADRILGRRADDVAGASVATLLPLADGFPAGSGEATLERPDGSTVPVAWSVAPSPAVDSGVAWVLSLHDLTERRKDERRRMEALVEQNRFKTQLLNVASHELNTPISVLRLQLDLLADRLGDADAQVRESVTLLDRNVGRLASLVRQTLDVARIQSDRFVVQPSRVRVDQLVEESCRFFRQAAQQKRVILVSQAAPLEFELDADRMSQVLSNLITNSLKFSPPGGTVLVAAQPTPEGLELRVEDSGIGLDEADMGKLFQPFSQGAGARVPGGVGLGLYICSSIVEAHGGRMTAQSRGRGQGAVFTCSLPARPLPQATLANAVAS